MSSRSSGPSDITSSEEEGERLAADLPTREEPPGLARARDEVHLLLAEAEASTDKAWASRVYFEAGYLQESALGQAKSAARTYTKSLMADPSFQPTAWALRRQLSQQGRWENLIRVIDAEARFASNTRSGDRADLLVERGTLLAHALDRPAEALTAFLDATVVDPKHRGAWIALLQQALSEGCHREAECAFEGLLATSRSSQETVAWTMALAEWLFGSPDATNLPTRASRAADILMRALAAGLTDPTLLSALDRFSLRAHSETLRLAALGAWEQTLSPSNKNTQVESAGLLALREKARMHVAAGDLPAAGAALDRALQIEPQHPVTLADRIELAVLEGRLDVFDDWQSRTDDPLVLSELLLRRADMALRKGAWGEAMGALGQISNEADIDDLCFVERIRTLAALQDAHALAQAYEQHADALLARAKKHHDQPKAIHEVAHQYVRAGVLWESELADSERAETLYRQALALAPSYRPAQEGLASVFTREGRWENLVDLVASDAAAAASSPRAPALRESLVLLNRDLLFDFPAALAAQALIVQSAPNEVRALYRWLDLAALVSIKDDGALDDALDAIGRLQALINSKAARAALWLSAARLAMGGSRDALVDAFVDRALAEDPTSLAAAFVERRSRAVPRRVIVALSQELAAHVRAAHNHASVHDLELVRALRFRQAFAALEAGQGGESLNALDPLVRQGDVSAWCWQVDIVRRLRDPLLLQRMLSGREGKLDLWNLSVAQDTRAQLLVLWGEVCEHKDRKEAASAAFVQAVEAARQAGSFSELLVRAWLGCLRTATAQTDIAGIVASLQALSDLFEGDVSRAFASEAQHTLLATGGSIDEADLIEGDPSLAFVAAARANNPDRLWSASVAVATQAQPGPARSRLWLQLGVNGLVLRKPEAASALHASYIDQANAATEIAITEIPVANPEGLAIFDPIISARLRRLTEAAAAGDEASAALAALLGLERAAVAEAEGRLGAAAKAYALVVELRPDSLEALEGLRRLAQLAGARSDEARLLERIGDSLASTAAAASHFAEAALLAEANGETTSAVRLFYKVLSLAPSDDEAFARLLGLLRTTGNVVGVENLLGFKLAQPSQQGARCIPLWLERARVRHGPLDDLDGAYADWQRVLAVDPQAFEPQLRLAQACRLRGATGAARARLQAAATCACDDDNLRLEGFVDLAEVCESQHDLGSAKLALERAAPLFETVTPGLSSRLVVLLKRLGMHVLVERTLKGLAARSEGATRGEHLAHAARVVRESGRLTDALTPAIESISEAPFGEAVLDLAGAGPVVSLDAAQRTVVESALAKVLLQLGHSGPLEPHLVELVEAYAKVLGQDWRVAVVQQLLFFLGQGSARGVARNISGHLNPDELFSLGTDTSPVEEGLASGLSLQAAWPLLSPSVCRAWATESAAPSGARAHRIVLSREARLNWFLAAAATVGVSELVLFAGPAEPAVTAMVGNPTSLSLAPSVMGGDPASRFRAGRALALCALGAPFLIAPLRVMSASDLVCAALGAAVPRGPLEAAGQSGLGAKIAKLISKKVHKGLLPLQESLVLIGSNTVNEWLLQVQRAANRFGLLVAGDLAESLFGLVGSRSREDIESNLMARDLILFALSDSYQEFRRGLGLNSDDVRPSSSGDSHGGQ